MRTLADTGTWWGRTWTNVLTAIGTSSLALLAFATVLVSVLGRRRELRRAGARGTHERSRLAAERLTKTVFDHWRQVTLAAPGSEVDLTDLLLDVSTSLPALDDAVLAGRVNRLVHAFVELAGYINLAPPQVVQRDGSYSAEMQREAGEWYRVRLEYTQALARRATWVGQSLGAHQFDRPLPAEEASSELPRLPLDRAWPATTTTAEAAPPEN